MEQMFEQIMENVQSTFDGSADFQSFAISMVLAILFGLVLQSLYNLYFHDNEPQDGSLARSLVLLTPALTATFWMIQSSLVLSLGLLGSLSFVRFRTPVKRAEDVSFIVVGLAVAIACASGHFAVAAVLVGLLFAYTFGRNAVDSRKVVRPRFAIITFNTSVSASADKVVQVLDELKVKPEFVSSRTYDGITSFVINANRVHGTAHDAITAKLHDMDKAAHINIFYPNERLGA